MARLLAEERKERAVRSSSIHAMRPHEVDALILAYAGIQWRVTGNGNVEYSRGDGRHLFTDRGNRVTFDRMRVTDDEIKLALIHSREKFGRQITLTGEEPIFVERMARLADDMGLKVLNPELQSLVQAHRAAKKEAAGRVAKESAQKALQESIQAPAVPTVPQPTTGVPDAGKAASYESEQNQGTADVVAGGEASDLVAIFSLRSLHTLLQVRNSCAPWCSESTRERSSKSWIQQTIAGATSVRWSRYSKKLSQCSPSILGAALT